jgi:hypothetical protein
LLKGFKSRKRASRESSGIGISSYEIPEQDLFSSAMSSRSAFRLVDLRPDIHSFNRAFFFEEMGPLSTRVHLDHEKRLILDGDEIHIWNKPGDD